YQAILFAFRSVITEERRLADRRAIQRAKWRAMNGFRHQRFGTLSARLASPIPTVTLFFCGLRYCVAVLRPVPNAKQPPAIAPSITTLGAVTLPTVAQQPITGETQPITPISTGGPFIPPLNPPGAGALSSGAGLLTFGQWIISPTLNISTLYDTNLYSSPTVPVRGPGVHFHPGLSADYNTGLYETQLYGSIDSTVYPTLNFINNTFNRNAGIIQKYS